MRRLSIPAAAFLASMALASGGAAAITCMADFPNRIFFNFASPEISQQARMSVQSAVKDWKDQDERCGTFSVIGHTDGAEAATGSDIGIRRTLAVIKIMEEEGIARKRITARDAGASEPLFRAPKDAREPQNRQVQIVWHAVEGERQCTDDYCRICYVTLPDQVRCRVH